MAVEPVSEDLRHDDLEYNPNVEPSKSRAWLNLLEESEKAFEDWNEHCDKIDKQYANLQRLANLVRDKEFQMFWANMEVIKPSIYARPPVPVVVPKFMDRRPVYQAAAELMERTAIVAFDLAQIDDVMIMLRDDVAITSRGVAWCRYESAKKAKGQKAGGNSYYDHERVVIDFKHRRDFLHSISRNWTEVAWVAAASYLTRSEARKRFFPTSGDAYQMAEYKVDKESKEVGGADARERAKFWEIWDKVNWRVVWVAEGCEDILDEDDPHLELRNFFPCPKPAYATVQRGSLVPVPEVMQYKDQLDEVNLLTGRIHALSEALEAKGFYPAGGVELADAVQAAIKSTTPGRVLVPVANWAAFGGTSEVIVWLPIDQIATTVKACVELRQEIIQDIYQITGLADIMRGATDPNETLGAQQLKTQYGSSRIQDKQNELVRIARDLVEITTEIITEEFKDVTIIEMSQTQLPTEQMVQMKAAQIMEQLRAQQAQVQQIQLQPQAQGMAQQNPQAAQTYASQAQLQIQQGFDALQKLRDMPTIEQVLTFVRNNRMKSFTLDIETDSTIIPDEQAEKQQRGEFVGVLAQLLPQLAQMITAEPQTAEFCGEILKFATAPYRAGRSLDAAIDALVDQMQMKGNQPQGPDPVTAQNQAAIQIEQMKVQAQQQRDAGELQFKMQELQQQDRHKNMELMNQRIIKQMELQAPASPDAEAKVAVQNQKLIENREAHQADMVQKQQDMALQRQKAEAQMASQAQKQQAFAARATQQARMNQQGPVMP